MNSAFFRSFLLTATLIFLSFLTLGVLFVGLASNFLTEQQRGQLEHYADFVLGLAGWGVSDWAYIGGNGEPVIEPKLSLLPDFWNNMTWVSTLTDTTIFVADSTGKILICSDLRYIGGAVSDDTLQSIQTSKVLGARALDGLIVGDRVSVGRTLGSPSGLVGGYLVVSATVAGQSSLLSGFTRLFLMAGLIVLLFSCVSAYLASRRMARPMQLMAHASRSFAQGEFDIRVPRGKSADEVDELAEAFNAMADALQKAEELRSGFIANVSHELKTPMTTIAGFIDGVLDGTIPAEKQTEYLTATRAEVIRLSRLVSNMLNIARLQAGQTPAPRPFDIVELLCRTLLSFEGAIERKGIRVETHLPEEAVVVLADPDVITQVVYNLLDNAVKYGAESGRLWVALAKKGGKLHVSVRNEGPTIPPEDLPYVFERFHKADKSRGVDKASLGLGLYIVKTILGNMHESITATSKNNVTEFTFTLSENKR